MWEIEKCMTKHVHVTQLGRTKCYRGFEFAPPSYITIQGEIIITDFLWRSLRNTRCPYSNTSLVWLYQHVHLVMWKCANYSTIHIQNSLASQDFRCSFTMQMLMAPFSTTCWKTDFVFRSSTYTSCISLSVAISMLLSRLEFLSTKSKLIFLFLFYYLFIIPVGKIHCRQQPPGGAKVPHVM